MRTRTRSRLTTQERREQLLQIGAELFATRPYGEVWIEEVAELAGVSRGLLYHYFSTKRDFLAAVVQAESDRLLELTEADPALSVRGQLRAGLDAYLEYVETHQYGYRALHRGAAAADERVRAIVEHGLAEQERRILSRLGADDRAAETFRIAVRGWLAFVVAVCLDWLERKTISRVQLRDLCAQALVDLVSFSEQPRQDDRPPR